MYTIFCFFTLFLFSAQVRTLEEGQACVKDGAPGTCIRLKNCQPAIDDIRHQKRPQHCSFAGREPVVCCVHNVKPAVTSTPIKTTVAPPVATTTKKKITTSTRAPLVYDYEEDNGKCEALSPTLTSNRTGNKSWDKCIDYQETLVYPCTTGVDLTSQLSRSNKCGHNTDELIIGGESAAVGEFPHMVLVSYGDLSDDQEWLCGGTLISDRFVLTAGHCTSNRNDPASYVAVGVYKRSTINRKNIYKIQDVIKHPEYKPPFKYNDIALLKTEQSIKLDQTVVPACLPVAVPRSGTEDKALATGWGTVEYRGELADILQKVILNKFPRNECALKFPTSRLMPRGFDPETQMCYGDKTKSKDTCQGDSGGPLQIRNKLLHCMYTVVGVTSFGKACGFIGDPGIYTRVENYLSWIEPFVWG